jgi:6-phosphogluconolactonase
MREGTAFVYVSGSDSPEIRVMRFDVASGAFTPLHTADAGPGSGYLTLRRTSAGTRLYGINRKPSRLLAFAVEADGALRAINQVVVDGGAFGATHLAVHPGGRMLLQAHFLSGHVSVNALEPDGAVGRMLDVQSTGREAHQAVCTADGRFLFVPCRAGDVVCQFVVDPATGKLTPNSPAVVEAVPGAGPRHMALHPSQRFAFLLDELDGTLTTYRLDPERGRLSEPHTVSNVPPGFREGAAAHVEVHPSGRYVYASNRQHGSIAIWAFDEASRRLQLVGYETAGGRLGTPRDFTLDPDGDLLLATNQDGGLVLAFRIQVDGTLQLAGTGQAQPGATCVAFLPRAGS